MVSTVTCSFYLPLVFEPYKLHYVRTLEAVSLQLQWHWLSVLCPLPPGMSRGSKYAITLLSVPSSALALAISFHGAVVVLLRLSQQRLWYTQLLCQHFYLAFISSGQSKRQFCSLAEVGFYDIVEYDTLSDNIIDGRMKYKQYNR